MVWVEKKKKWSFKFKGMGNVCIAFLSWNTVYFSLNIVYQPFTYIKFSFCMKISMHIVSIDFLIPCISCPLNEPNVIHLYCLTE